MNNIFYLFMEFLVQATLQYTNNEYLSLEPQQIINISKFVNIDINTFKSYIYLKIISTQNTLKIGVQYTKNYKNKTSN